MTLKQNFILLEELIPPINVPFAILYYFIWCVAMWPDLLSNNRLTFGILG